ncbi:MAG TPA: OmpH family outer membrane protein [Chitinophagaceae bacterium]|nr:OmpH family outer membrane protein [Chitinophagaceae bacterium]
MKKLQVLVVAVGLLIAGNASAQTKIAYIRIDDIVGLMPELSPQKLNMDTVGQQFIKDSVMPRLTYVQSEYQRKLVEYGDTTKAKGVRDQILRDLQGYKEELDAADGLIQQVQQFKQQELLKPYYAKAKKAIDAVAKKKGYTHVFSSDVFLVAPEADDLSMAVLTELNIKLPNQGAANKPGAAVPPKKN